MTEKGRPSSSKQAAVVDLRRRGLNFEEIGQALGMSKQGAHDHWRRFLASPPRPSIEEQTVIDFEEDVRAMRAALHRGRADVAASVAEALTYTLRKWA